MTDINLNEFLDGLKDALLDFGKMIVTSSTSGGTTSSDGKVSSGEPSSGSSGGKGGESGGIVSSIASSLGKLESDIGPTAVSLAALGKTTNAATDIIGDAAKKLGGTAGNNIASFMTEIAKGREQLNAAGKQGIGDNNYFKLQEQAALAGQQIAEFTQTIADAGGNLNSMGSNASSVAENFSKYSKEIQETDIGGKLKLAGWDSTELAKVGALSAANTRLNIADQNVRNKLANSAAELANQFDETSRITGKSREALEAEFKSRTQSTTAILQQQLMTEDQKAAFKSAQATTKDFLVEGTWSDPKVTKIDSKSNPKP